MVGRLPLLRASSTDQHPACAFSAASRSASSTIAMTCRYAHVADKSMREAVAELPKLDRAIGFAAHGPPARLPWGEKCA